MNVRSSIVATVIEIEAAVRELQAAGVLRAVDVPARVEWQTGPMPESPLSGDLHVVIPAANDQRNRDRPVDVEDSERPEAVSG